MVLFAASIGIVFAQEGPVANPPAPAPAAAIAAAVPAASPAAAAVKSGEDMRTCGRMAAEPLLARSYNIKRNGAQETPYEIATKARPADERSTLTSLLDRGARQNDVRQGPNFGRVLFVLERPEEIDKDVWQSSYAYGAAQTDPIDPKDPIHFEPIGVSIKERTQERALAEVSLPNNLGNVWQQKWTIVAVICGGKGNHILGFGSAKIEVVSSYYAWRVAVGWMVVFWLLMALATWELHKKKLKDMWDNPDISNFLKGSFGDKPIARNVWFFLNCINPLFMSQDSLGFCSLSRLQILMFTTIVGLVLLYIFIHSAVISTVSDTILLLLGVTVAGGTLARAVGGWQGLSAPNRAWLIGKEILKMDQDRPRWKDLFESQGEIDVAKVQAFLFTGLICFSILFSGYNGLSNFYLPEQTVYLALISQVAYVGGKLVPTETRKELDRDLNELLKLMAAYPASPSDTDRAAYAQARLTAMTTLRQTYSNQFDEVKFRQLVPDPTPAAKPAST